MPLLKTSVIRKTILFLVAAIFSLSTMAADFSQTKQLANQGNASAQYNLGVMYYKGDGVPQDHSKATEWFQKAANQGHTKAQFNLEAMYINASDDFDRVKKLAEQGDSFYQDSLGDYYRKGTSVPQDHSKAFYWYQKSANQGSVVGQFMVGSAYSKGRGVRQDYAKSFEWLKKASQNNKVNKNNDMFFFKASSEAIIGAMYEGGLGVRQSKTEAKEWYGKACDNGNNDGCDLYRKMNEQGY